MTNKQISDIFTDIYNGFWIKHRDNLPDLQDDSGWDTLKAEANVLATKHDCQLAQDMAYGLLEIMDQRMRRKTNAKIKI